MHEKHKPGDAYNPEAFADRSGYDKSLNELEAQYQKKLKQK
jgi:metallo-beta-lactamase class B